MATTKTAANKLRMTPGRRVEEEEVVGLVAGSFLLLWLSSVVAVVLLWADFGMVYFGWRGALWPCKLLLPELVLYTSASLFDPGTSPCQV